MVGSGKPVKINATNSAPVKTASKKRRVAATSVVEGESGPSAVEDNKESPIEPEVVVQPAPDAQPSGGEEAEVKPKLDVTAMLEKLKEDVAAQLAGLKIIAALLRETVKTHGKELRAKGSRKRKNAETEPGVVVEPKPEKTFEIQEPLRDFLGTQPGELVGKRAARKTLSQYIKDNKLQDPDDHTLIKPDEKLAKLFGPPRYVTIKKNLGYSNLNALRYIQDYFIVPTEEVAAPEPEPTPVA